MKTPEYAPKWSIKLLKRMFGTPSIVHPLSVLSFPLHEFQALDPEM